MRRLLDQIDSLPGTIAALMGAILGWTGGLITAALLALAL